MLHAVPAATTGVAVEAIDPQSYAKGGPLGIDRTFRLADAPLWLGFIDLEPGRSLGHRALTVIVPDDGSVGVRDAQFPPALADGRGLQRLAEPQG